MAQKRYTFLVVYLDDILVTGETKKVCLKAYNALCKFLLDLSFQLSQKRLVPPTQNLVFPSVEIDIIELSLCLSLYLILI